MTSLKKLLMAAGLTSATVMGTAHAGTYTIDGIFNGNNPLPGNEFDQFESALPTSGSIFDTRPNLYTGTYTGTVNFADPAGGTDTIKGFLATGTGTFSASTAGLTETLSGTNFTTTTGIELTFTTATTESLTIGHDDGVALFTSGNMAVDLLPTSAAPPTALSDNTVTVGPGTYNLYYVEANGLPADLSVTATAVPEPASLAVLGVGLLGLTAALRRRSFKA